ncbi:hypothetical protein ES705_30552 [subsurface metagenome]
MRGLVKKTLKLKVTYCNHTHWLAAQISPQAKAIQRVCVPTHKKEIFKNTPHATKKKTINDTYRQEKMIDRLTLWDDKKRIMFDFEDLSFLYPSVKIRQYKIGTLAEKTSVYLFMVHYLK